MVDPGQEYEVTVHHLPKPIPDGDPNHKSRIILVPGRCRPRGWVCLQLSEAKAFVLKAEFVLCCMANPKYVSN